MNPFKMRPERTGDLFVDWEKFWVKPYNKNEVNPYTRTRIILMNGTEFENVWFSHQFSRSVGDDELRRKLAYIRKSDTLSGIQTPQNIIIISAYPIAVTNL